MISLIPLSIVSDSINLLSIGVNEVWFQVSHRLGTHSLLRLPTVTLAPPEEGETPSSMTQC